MNDSYKFQIVCKNAIIDYYKEYRGIGLLIEDVYTVWTCKALQNQKALLSTVVEDGLYFECTYNGDKDEMYLDVYDKRVNICIEAKDFKTDVKDDSNE